MPVRRIRKTRLKGASFARPRKRKRDGKFASNGAGILRLRKDIRRERRKREGGLVNEDTLKQIKAYTKGEVRGSVQVKSAKLKMNKTKKTKGRIRFTR